jgi:CTP synthase (UTP-ammonia lyase)
MSISLGIVGDFKADNKSHIATNEAIQHCAAALGMAVQSHWIATTDLAEASGLKQLSGFQGLWIAPASPYKSMEGALNAIRWARENRVTLLGTCGGFQHIILEYARNVLGFANAQHQETDPNADCLFISRLTCSLVGRTLTIKLVPGSLIASLYGQTTVQEQYHCNFGVNPDYVDTLGSGALHIVGSDNEGAVRAVELSGHPFFLGTLFLPQHTSTPTAPHPLITGFFKACDRHSGG